MRIFCLCWLLLWVFVVSAQTSGSAQAQIEKMKKKIEEDKHLDPAQKQMMLQMLDSKGIKNAAQYSDQHPGEMARAKAIEEGKAVLPARDPKRIEVIPPAPVSLVQVREYAVGLSAKLARKMEPALRNHADSLLRLAGDNGPRISATAMEEWLAGDPVGAAYLAAAAVDTKPDPNILANFGGMLNQLGNEEKAIPLLQYGLKQTPKDAVLLNNLGRAWLGLGEVEKAKTFFLACIRQEPFHPEANNSLGCIYEAGKDIDGAIQCYKHSLEGAFNESAFDRLVRLQPEADITELIANHFSPPRFFDEFRIQLPDECREILQVEAVRREHEAFEWSLGDLRNQYGQEEKAEQQKAEQEQKEYQRRLLQALQAGAAISNPLPPFGKLAVQMIARLDKNYSRDRSLARKDYDSAYHQLLDDFRKAAARIREKYQKQRNELKFEGEGGINEEAKAERLAREECAALLALTNEYQDQAATLHQTFAERYRPLLLNYFNAKVYWVRLMSPGPAFNNANFYDCITGFLEEMDYLSASTPFMASEYLCERPKTAGPAAKDRLTADKKPSCPLSFKIGFVVGSISINCTSFSLSGGEGIKLGYKFNFTNQQSTLSVGAGLGLDIGIGATASANASESFYITFDGNGQPSDAGFKFEAGATGKIGSFSENASTGYTLGLNSGWNFSTPAMGVSVKLN